MIGKKIKNIFEIPFHDELNNKHDNIANNWLVLLFLRL